MFRSNSHKVKITNAFTEGSKINIQVTINGSPGIPTPPGESSGPHPVSDNNVIVIEIIRPKPSPKRYQFCFTGAGKTYTYKKFFLKGDKQEINVVYKPPGFSILSWIRWILTRGPDNIGVGPDE